jgi:NADPH:quinone reductase-like Zn-dependent oxidoreductase
MKIQPASIDQVLQTREGEWLVVHADTGSVALQIEEIARARGAHLELHRSEHNGIYKVVQFLGDEEQLVTTALEADQRLVDKVREVTSPHYDIGAELDKLEAEKDRSFEHQQAEKIGDIGERLAHALRVDRHVQRNF